jgi:resolvase-like protein
MNGKRVGIYLRVSTGGQTVENQRQALIEAVTHRGWRVVEEFVAGSAAPKGATSALPSIGYAKLSPRGPLIGSADSYRILSAFSES